MKVLFISNLFPDAAEPNRGIYNARLVRHLARRCEVRVLSPRPALPLLRKMARQPRAEDRDLQPGFPPVWYLPKIGSRWNHHLMARCLLRLVDRLRCEFAFDVVLASWVYPDGCSVSRLAARLRFPFVVVAQGSDVHQYLQKPLRQRIIVRELNRAGAIITRSRALAHLLQEAGVSTDKLHVIYNGVDFDVFQPGDALKARRELALPDDAAIVLYVGNFLPIKNPQLLLTAFAELQKGLPSRKAHLVMVGYGPLRAAIQRQADRGGLGECISLVGRKSALEVVRYMQAADVLCVPSDNEGVPNVVLEAFATGLPVVATRVGGIPEIMCHDSLGRVVEKSNPAALVTALTQTLSEKPDRNGIMDYARRFSWESAAGAYWDLLQTVSSSQR